MVIVRNQASFSDVEDRRIMFLQISRSSALLFITSNE